ncbi:hypothetical protein N7532_007580 [Penicillium argentinense]|uniref:FAD-binding domain-containing protein n=1 Tax=Penicillium argentinense TaxID=1131581 RepID=A0A9W9F805_9EURO|nr:uncharacterized protein N7532_007580 [Penicillium argentinense]KAJ5095289.1 hypothetical protein N7532_007580 [Penicillium argentinense]
MAHDNVDELLGGSSLKTPTYPSNCLAFLNQSAPKPLTNKAKVHLNIIVVGAGLGGLSTAIALASTGHTVTVYEQAPELGEVGAGIQIPSNSTRLLSKLGLDQYLTPHVTEPSQISFRRWESGAVIGLTRLIPDFRDTFGAPYYVIHRANFHSALHARAVELGVVVKLASRVVRYTNDSNPFGETGRAGICLVDGRFVCADLVVASDGVKSIARELVDQSGRPIERTGFAAYRATVDVSKIQADPEISWLLERPALNIWYHTLPPPHYSRNQLTISNDRIGDQRHVMTYTINSGKSFNMVLSHPDNTDPASWDQTTALRDMRREFQGWDSRLQKIISMITNTIKWPLVSGTPLPRWTAGRIVMLGDAAHAMLPYMSQGAAMAVEDAIALSTSLSKLTSTHDLPTALSIFEKARIDRTSKMQEASLLNGKLWHFADGPLQRARDAAMKPEVDGVGFSHSPNQWSDPVTQIWTYGYDAEGAVERAWREYRVKCAL